MNFRQVFLNQSAADGDYLRGGLRRDGILLYESGTAAGILDCFAYLGASVQAIFFGSVLTNSSNWTLVFTAIAGVCVAIIIIAIIAGWGLNQEKKEEKAA